MILFTRLDFGHYYFGHQIERERQRAELQDKQQLAAISAINAEQSRRQEILKQLREYYIMTILNSTPSTVLFEAGDLLDETENILSFIQSIILINPMNGG